MPCLRLDVVLFVDYINLLIIVGMLLRISSFYIFCNVTRYERCLFSGSFISRCATGYLHFVFDDDDDDDDDVV